MLTYPGAQDFVQSIYDQIKAEYRVPPCFVSYDEPAGDFGIAHFHGLTDDGCASLTFDDNRIPWEYTVKHEIGHALSALWNQGSSAGPMHEAWWQARGFPGTAWDAQLRAIAAEQMKVNSGYIYWPEEAFADTFSIVNMTNPPPPLTYQYNVWLDKPKMLAFYKALGENMDPQVIKDAVVAALSDFGLDANTFKFIKDRLSFDANHEHGVNGTITTKPVDGR